MSGGRFSNLFGRGSGVRSTFAGMNPFNLVDSFFSYRQVMWPLFLNVATAVGGLLGVIVVMVLWTISVSDSNFKLHSFGTDVNSKPPKDSAVYGFFVWTLPLVLTVALSGVAALFGRTIFRSQKTNLLYLLLVTVANLIGWGLWMIGVVLISGRLHACLNKDSRSPYCERETNDLIPTLVLYFWISFLALIVWINAVFSYLWPTWKFMAMGMKDRYTIDGKPVQIAVDNQTVNIGRDAMVGLKSGEAQFNQRLFAWDQVADLVNLTRDARTAKLNFICSTEMQQLFGGGEGAPLLSSNPPVNAPMGRVAPALRAAARDDMRRAAFANGQF